ncbi:MAG: hypothetical protein JW959_08060 [Pirellulales bacterium]|nr:hypothetical protein [Pirellulales bacterium]
MFSASLYFLGVAGFIVAALVCLSKGRRTERCVEVDLGSLRAAAVCFLGGCRMAERNHQFEGDNPPERTTPKWREMKSLWLQWYAHCQQQAQLKRKTLLSWGRTLVVCALLCIVGVYLEVRFDETVSWENIFDGLLQ